MLPTKWTWPLLITGLVGACAGAPERISGEPPQVNIRLLEQAEQAIHLDLDIRNINDQRLPVKRLELTLEHADRLLATIDQPLDLVISARGQEGIALEAPLSPAAQEVLAELADGSRTSLPWQIRGRLVDQAGRNHAIEAGGHLYPVPGRPGQFR